MVRKKQALWNWPGTGKGSGIRESDLSDPEAEKFRPVDKRYAPDLTRTYDTKIALFQEYLEANQTMPEDQAESY